MPGKRYHESKEHKGKSYKGMRVGGIHRWTYPDGSWKERKRTPRDWDIVFTSHKRRRGRAPRGSGAEIGSEYHWYILAHQWVRKEDANTYSTVMEGQKSLIAFKKPDWERWNTQFRNQKPARQKVIAVLEEALERLKAQDTVENPWDEEMFEGLAMPRADEDPAPEILQRLAARAREATAAAGAT